MGVAPADASSGDPLAPRGGGELYEACDKHGLLLKLERRYEMRSEGWNVRGVALVKLDPTQMRFAVPDCGRQFTER